jgi:hypothetical protein
MIFRKASLGAVIISLALLLTSCVEVRGDLSVSSTARINGEIIYTLNKSLAAGVGLNTLAEVKNEASTNPEAQIGFCKDAPITEDASSYILKCALKDVLTDSGEISASVTGGNIVFRYKANLDPSSNQGDQTNFGSVSITIRFLDPVISFTENKVGLVSKVDDRTYRISGTANEPMNIEITANLAASSGSTIIAPAPAPSTTTNPTGESSTAVEAANKAAADKAAADLKAKQEAEAEAAEEKAAADLKAKQEAEAKAAADKAAEELKVKQEAEAKAAAELKAKQEAEAKAAADKAAEELKVKQEAEAKAAAELKAKKEAEAAEKAAADLKAKQEAEAKAIADKAAADLKAKQAAEAKASAEKAAALLKAKQAADAKAAAAKILAAAKAKAAAAAKKTTITCVKGKLTKKVTAVKPVCPKGYKKK